MIYLAAVFSVHFLSDVCYINSAKTAQRIRLVNGSLNKFWPNYDQYVFFSFFCLKFDTKGKCAKSLLTKRLFNLVLCTTIYGYMIDKGKCLLGKHSIIDSAYADLLLYLLMTLQVDSHFELLKINLNYDKAEIF